MPCEHCIGLPKTPCQFDGQPTTFGHLIGEGPDAITICAQHSHMKEEIVLPEPGKIQLEATTAEVATLRTNTSKLEKEVSILRTELEKQRLALERVRDQNNRSAPAPIVAPSIVIDETYLHKVVGDFFRTHGNELAQQHIKNLTNRLKEVKDSIEREANYQPTYELFIKRLRGAEDSVMANFKTEVARIDKWLKDREIDFDSDRDWIDENVGVIEENLNLLTKRLDEERRLLTNFNTKLDIVKDLERSTASKLELIIAAESSAGDDPE